MELINRLEQFGLSKRESEVYVALLQKKEFTAPELTKITTITRTKIYEHLQSLIRKGFCHESLKNGQKIYRAANPKVVLQSIITSYEQEIEQKKIAAISLKEDLEEIHLMNLQKEDNLDYIEILKDKNEIKNRFLILQKEARKEMLVFNKAPYSIKPVENVEYEKNTIKKKIIYKGLYEYQDLASEQEKSEFIKVLEVYSKLGEEVRIIKKLPIKLAIIDEKITMLALKDPVSLMPSITTMIVSHKSFAQSLKEVFESYWEKSVSLKDFKKLKTKS